MEEEAQIRHKIKQTVLKILQNSNMDDTTEYAVRNTASRDLQIDLSASPQHKRLVRQVVETYLSGHRSDAEPDDTRGGGEKAEEEPPATKEKTTSGGAEPELKEDARGGGVSLKADDGGEKAPPRKRKESGGDKEYNDSGELIVCKLSAKRMVTIQEFRGRTLVSMREYYEKDGKQFPSAKGISLTTEQWSILKTNVPAIEKAIGKMEASMY